MLTNTYTMLTNTYCMYCSLAQRMVLILSAMGYHAPRICSLTYVVMLPSIYSNARCDIYSHLLFYKGVIGDIILPLKF